MISGIAILRVYSGIRSTPISLQEYRNVPVAEIQQDYLPVDGHPNAGGQALIARLIAGQLTRGAVPELKAKSVTGAAQ